MSLSQILESSDSPSSKEQIVRACRDLVRQTDLTVKLIHYHCEQDGKNAILDQMSDEERSLFLLIWSKIESAAAGTDYQVPTLKE